MPELMTLADLLDNCVFNTNLAADPVLQFAQQYAYQPFTAAQQPAQQISTQAVANRSVSEAQKHPFVDFVSQRMYSEQQALRSDDLLKLINQLKEQNSRFEADLAAERRANKELLAEIKHLRAYAAESLEAQQKKETELVEQARQGYECVLQLNIMKETASQLQRQLKQEQTAAKQQSALLKELMQFIEESTPALHDARPKKRTTREEKAGKALVTLETETQARARELADVLARAKEDPQVLYEYDVVGALKQVKARRVQVRDLTKYRKGVYKLGVVVK